MASIILKPGREQSVLRRHPWVFSGAVQKVEGSLSDGDTVDILDSKKNWLARGSYSSKSQISVRLLTFDESEIIGGEFWHRRLRRAIVMRNDLAELRGNDSFRLVNAESDGMPGVIIDRYGDFLVCQFSSAGAEFWREEIVRQLGLLWPCAGIFERSDGDGRFKEGYPARVITLQGSPPPPYILIHEQDLLFNVDVVKGHKTGFYLDQAVNRKKIIAYCKGAEVLNAFSYTGGFGVAAGKGGARQIVNVDSSGDALELARINSDLNGISPDSMEYVCKDVFQLLRTYRDSRRQFDLIILDPPKFVASAGQLSGGARGYKDINLLAFKLIRPGGVLVTFSCSGYVTPELFRKIVADAAIDAGRHVKILEFLYQSPDHAMSLEFPEGLYLKGLICKVE